MKTTIDTETGRMKLEGWRNVSLKVLVKHVVKMYIRFIVWKFYGYDIWGPWENGGGNDNGE